MKLRECDIDRGKIEKPRRERERERNGKIVIKRAGLYCWIAIVILLPLPALLIMSFYVLYINMCIVATTPE
jgi:hypothetical protein